MYQPGAMGPPDPRVLRVRGQVRSPAGIIIDFDAPLISHLEGNLWQGGCSDGLVLPDGFRHVVSLYPWEQYTIQHELRSVHLHFLLDSDETVPPIVHDIAAWVDACEREGPTLVHCQQGLNRSSLILGLVLMRRGRSADQAIELIRKMRSPACLFNRTFEAYLRAQAPGSSQGGPAPKILIPQHH